MMMHFLKTQQYFILEKTEQLKIKQKILTCLFTIEK